MVRADPREHAHPGEHLVEVSVGERVEVRAGDDWPAGPQVKFGGNSLGGARVVSGEHHDLDARGAQLADRPSGGAADRVGEREQPGEVQPLDPVLAQVAPGRGVCEDPVAVLGEPAGLVGQRPPAEIVQRDRAVAALLVCAERQHDLGCALDREPLVRRGAAEDGVVAA